MEETKSKNQFNVQRFIQHIRRHAAENGIIDFKDPQAFAVSLMQGYYQTLLETEMEAHLGYPKHAPEGKGSGNSRNGRSTIKRVKTELGEIEISTPRDRARGKL